MSDGAVERASRTIGAGLGMVATAVDALDGGDVAQSLSRVALAVENSLSSPNVEDSNSEPANVVDVLDRLARSIYDLSESVEKLATAHLEVERIRSSYGQGTS